MGERYSLVCVLKGAYTGDKASCFVYVGALPKVLVEKLMAL